MNEITTDYSMVIWFRSLGLPTAALFANSGFRVVGVARDKNKLQMINEGKSPVMEPGLQEIVKKQLIWENYLQLMMG